MMDCRQLKFSEKYSNQRLQKAKALMGKTLVNRLLGFALYLLGASRQTIADFLGISYDTFKSFTDRVEVVGFDGFSDRRQKETINNQPLTQEISIEHKSEDIRISIGSQEIIIQESNELQLKIMILTLFHNNLITTKQAADILNISKPHVGFLSNKLLNEDAFSLIDKRQGQKSDYVFTPEVKSELILQFVLNAATNGKTSGSAIASALFERTDMNLSERSIRHHLSKLGLKEIAGRIASIVSSQKKKLQELINEAIKVYPEKKLLEAKKHITRLATVKLLQAGLSKEFVSIYTNCHISTVHRWEERQDIFDLPRSGRPSVYGQEQQLKLIGFYCQSQPLPASGRWSLRMAEDFLKANPSYVDFSASKSTVHRILQGHNLKPHRSKYFLHISDPDFFPKMEHLIGLYLNPPKNFFCFDESPGIQVLQRLVPDMRTEENKIRLEEFEYIRHGTLDLFACLEVSTGKIFSECHCCHDTDILVHFLEKHFLSIPNEEPIHYLLDNLSTHCSYTVCELVARYSNVECPSEKELNTMEKRRIWLQGKDKRIIFHFTPFHGSWLNMVEIWFGIMAGKCLRESYASPDAMLNAINAFTEMWNTLLAHPFNWQYTGDGLHEKAMTRFTRNLQSETVLQVELRVLTKQMKLMNNLICDYKNKIPEKCIKEFYQVFILRKNELIRKINEEPGIIRKKNAQLALENLNATLSEIAAIAEIDKENVA